MLHTWIRRNTHKHNHIHRPSPALWTHTQIQKHNPPKRTHSSHRQTYPLHQAHPTPSQLWDTLRILKLARNGRWSPVLDFLWVINWSVATQDSSWPSLKALYQSNSECSAWVPPLIRQLIFHYSFSLYESSLQVPGITALKEETFWTPQIPTKRFSFPSEAFMCWEGCTEWHGFHIWEK